MNNNIESFIKKPVDIKWRINNFKCQKHQSNKKPCEIYVDLKKYTINMIHHIHYNYMVKNYDAYCVRRYSNRNTLLNYCSKINTSNKDKDYITVDAHTVYKINYSYITFALLIYINELALNTDIKMWGMFNNIINLFIL